MENFRGGKIQLTCENALASIRWLETVADPSEREKIVANLSLRLNLPVLIDVLHKFLSFDELAAVAGVSDGKTVKGWSRSIKRPRSTIALENLRLALRISATVYDNNDPDAVREWFRSQNEYLGNRSPLTVFTERDFRGAPRLAKELLGAAKEDRKTPTIA